MQVSLGWDNGICICMNKRSGKSLKLSDKEEERGQNADASTTCDVMIQWKLPMVSQSQQGGGNERKCLLASNNTLLGNRSMANIAVTSNLISVHLIGRL